MNHIKSPNSKMNTLLAIPIYNEAQYIVDVLSAAQQHIRDILVIDDGSSDNTSGILADYQDINVITHGTNLGYGRSLIDALNYASDQKYDWVITMDCDFQHEPGHIQFFLKSIAQNRVDIISGSRYLKPSPIDIETVPSDRLRINRKITRILNESLGLSLTDSFCGFKAYRVSSLLNLPLSINGYGLPLQFWIQAARARLRIQEIAVPLVYHDPNRQFHGNLEDPDARLDYYMNILHSELKCHVNPCS